jgi:hypothetical protein
MCTLELASGSGQGQSLLSYVLSFALCAAGVLAATTGVLGCSAADGFATTATISCQSISGTCAAAGRGAARRVEGKVQGQEPLKRLRRECA